LSYSFGDLFRVLATLVGYWILMEEANLQVVISGLH
jgi:hypothetical protein